MSMQALDQMNKHRFFSKNASTIALVLASLFLFLVLVLVALDFNKLRQVKKSIVPTTRSDVVVAPTKNYRLNDIISANLMGNPTVVKPKPVVKKAPKTKLNLKLEGILFSKDVNSARVMIKVGKNKTKIYSTGDKLDKVNATVETIRSEEVLLDRSGVIESLPMIKKKLDLATNNNDSPKIQSAAQSPSYPAPFQPKIDSESNPEIELFRKAEKARRLQEF